MSITIWKFPLTITDVQQVLMPHGAIILTCQTQGEAPVLWAIVDPDRPEANREIHMFGTGHPIPPNGGGRRYIGTFQIAGGSLVFHVFEAVTVPLSEKVLGPKTQGPGFGPGGMG
jgi:hypothetical protein